MNPKHKQTKSTKVLTSVDIDKGNSTTNTTTNNTNTSLTSQTGKSDTNQTIIMIPVAKTLINIKINDIEINLNEELYIILKLIGDILKPTEELDLWSQVMHTNKDIKSNVGKAFGQVLRKNNYINIWQEYFAVLSGGYIYFYNKSDDVDYANFYYIKDAEIKTTIDKENNDYIIELNNGNSQEILKFANERKQSIWLSSINERINEMKITFESKEIELTQKKEKIEKKYEDDSSLLDEVFFSMSLNLKNISLVFYGGDKNLYENSDKIFNVSFINFTTLIDLKKDESHIELGLQKIKLYEYNNTNEKFANILRSSDTDSDLSDNYNDSNLISIK